MSGGFPIPPCPGQPPEITLLDCCFLDPHGHPHDLFSILDYLDTTGPLDVPSSNSAGSAEPAPNQSGSTRETGSPPSVDDRKRRRMISNRESARRSRMRKQKHLEDLRSQVNRLRSVNKEITNRLCIATYQCHLVARDNDRLRSEHGVLRHRLSELRRLLVLQQLQQILPTIQQIPQLIS